MQVPPTDPPYDASWMKVQCTLQLTAEDVKGNLNRLTLYRSVNGGRYTTARQPVAHLPLKSCELTGTAVKKVVKKKRGERERRYHNNTTMNHLTS